MYNIRNNNRKCRTGKAKKIKVKLEILYCTALRTTRSKTVITDFFQLWNQRVCFLNFFSLTIQKATKTKSLASP